ncbi:MAG TPA: FG-GAP repeat protein [Chitinophagaceae bacterium]|nr:FG-GAP repeat protein [Chitinophagaceae bacterium]
MKPLLLFLLLLITGINKLRAQSVSINTDGSAPNPNAILDVKSTSKGVMLPRVSTAQRKAMPVQPSDAGLLVFDIEKMCLYLYTGSQWKPVPFSSDKDIYPVTHGAADGEENDSFGAAVALSGNYAVITAPNDDVGANSNQGSAYIFFYNNNAWTQVQKITASDGVANDNFGTSVAIDGDYLVVGTSNHQQATGAAYIFVRNGNTWTQQARIQHNDAEIGDDFGRAVAIQGNKVVVGAPGNDNGQYINQGSAYIFIRNGSTWTQNSKLIPDDLANSDRFGSSVSIDGDYLAVGAPHKSIDSRSRAGAVFVFTTPNGTTWNLQQRITDLSPAFEEYFGRSISIQGSELLIGVPGEYGPSATMVGKMALYKRNNTIWIAHQEMYSTEPQNESQLGINVALSNGIAIGTACFHDEQGIFNSGAAWVYKKLSDTPGDWTFYRKISDTEVERIAFFGTALAIDRQTNRYIIGSNNADNGKGRVAFGSLQ